MWFDNFWNYTTNPFPAMKIGFPCVLIFHRIILVFNTGKAPLHHETCNESRISLLFPCKGLQCTSQWLSTNSDNFKNLGYSTVFAKKGLNSNCCTLWFNKFWTYVTMTMKKFWQFPESFRKTFFQLWVTQCWRKTV